MYKKLHQIFIVFGFLLGVLVRPVFAEVYFEERFDSRNDTKWTFSQNDGSITFSDGSVVLAGSGEKFPSIIAKRSDLLSIRENLVFEARFMFTDRNTMGDGIGIGFTNSYGYPFYQFAVWNGSNHGPILVHNNFNVPFYNYCDLRTSTNDSYGVGVENLILTDNVWHIMRVEKTGLSYSVFIDKDTNPIPVFTTTNNQCIPKVVFIGNPLGGGSSTWTSLKVDYIKVYDGVAEEANKIVILPGLGASWSERAMVFNQNVNPNEWKMTPFVKNYNQLIDTFEQNGFVEDSDFYVWNYDWRKPLAEIVTDFGNYVTSLGLDGGDQLDLVGHSLGGLVARVWTQENPDTVGRVITLGSPHFGAVKAYEVWNGARVGDKFDAQSIALNVLLQLQKKNKNNLVETVRAYAPILRDILPTFDYLKFNNAVVPAWVNEYLINKNLSVSDIFSKLLAVIGDGYDTKEWINLTTRNVFDQVLGLWEGGKPKSYTYGDGDGTVLGKSAKFDGDVFIGQSSEHGVLPDNSINLIIEELGLGDTIVEIASMNVPMAVFYLGSPAKMTADCGTGSVVVDNDGWITVANKKIEECKLTLIGTEGGIYHLAMGNSWDDQSWQYLEGVIGVGESKILSLSDRGYWYGRILADTELLLGQFKKNNHLLNMKKAAINKNFNQLLNSYISFRKEKRETEITFGMMTYLENILNLEKIPSSEELNDAKLKALQAMWLADKKVLKPTEWQALTYKQAEDLMINPNYARYFLAGKLFGIVWN